MPSTYTNNGGIELPANGEQSATWGNTVNDNMSIIDRLTNGVGTITLSGTTHTLTTSDGTLSDGQYKTSLDNFNRHISFITVTVLLYSGC